MSKIAIISRPDQGVLIDVGGCETLKEATHHLTSTLQISSEFWKGLNVDLNLGKLVLDADEVASIMSIAREVGVEPAQVFTEDDKTRESLASHQVPIGTGVPMRLPEPGAQTAAETSASEKQEDLSISLCPEAGTAEETPPQEGSAADKGSATADSAPPKAQPPAQPAVLYLRQTLRSGQTVSHKGHLVIVGDVNPGAEVVADGDITVWGALRGIAHAGLNGNTQAEIRALRLEPIQIRIAHAIARSPDRPRGAKTQSGPETARIVAGSIRIAANNPD